jgi:hypothetical protein
MRKSGENASDIRRSSGSSIRGFAAIPNPSGESFFCFFVGFVYKSGLLQCGLLQCGFLQ